MTAPDRIRAAVAWLRAGLRAEPWWRRLLVWMILVSMSRVAYDGGEPGFRPHPPTHPVAGVLTFVLGGAVLFLTLAWSGHQRIDGGERRAQPTPEDRP